MNNDLQTAEGHLRDDMSAKYLIGVDLMEGNYVRMRFTLSKCCDLPLSHGLHPTATTPVYLCMGKKLSLRIPYMA